MHRLTMRLVYRTKRSDHEWCTSVKKTKVHFINTGIWNSNIRDRTRTNKIDNLTDSNKQFRKIGQRSVLELTEKVEFKTIQKI